MYSTIGDIRSAIQSFRSDSDFTELKTRWHKDYDLYTLKPYDAGKGYYSYTSNLPRVFADKIISSVQLGKLFIRIPDDVLTKDTREMANNVERFWYGCYNINDERNLLIPNMPSILAQKIFYSAIRGGFATRTLVYKNEKSKTIPEVRVWDLYSTAYMPSDNGLLWATNTRQASRAQLEKDFNKKVPSATSMVDVIEYIDKEKYGVFCGNEWIIPLTAHNVGECPVHIFRNGAMPVLWQENYTNTASKTGESIFSTIRGIMPILNKTTSDYLTLVRRGVKSPYVVMTSTGESQIDEDIWQVEKAAKIDLKTGESITPLVPQTMPPDTAAILSWISGETQRGTLPYTAYGELDFRLSGYAINQLHVTLETVTYPVVECVSRSYLMECRQLISQYTKGKFSPITVRGRNSKGQAFGYPTAAKIAPSDLAGDWFPEVELVPILPKDNAQQIQLANMAREGDIPLLSMKRIRSDYLGVQDADLESAQIALEWSDNLTINRLYEAYIRAVADRDSVRAENILYEVRRIQSERNQPAAGAQSSRQTPYQGEATSLPGAGTPVPQTGVPSSTMPAEAMGGMPPGAMNAVQARMAI